MKLTGLVLGSALSLTACRNDTDTAELQGLVDTLHAHTRPMPATTILPTAALRKPLHANVPQRDPFSPVQTVHNTPAESTKPDVLRPREPLELYPLETLHWVGNLRHDGVLWALIRAESGTVYRARSGSHLGLDNGKIIQLDDTRMEISEWVLEGNGIWHERLKHIEWLNPGNQQDHD